MKQKRFRKVVEDEANIYMTILFAILLSIWYWEIFFNNLDVFNGIFILVFLCFEFIIIHTLLKDVKVYGVEIK